MGWHFAFVGTDTTVYRQGAVVKVTPSVDRSPAGTVEIPLRCTSGWRVTGPATLAADRTTIAIAPDAPPGAIVQSNSATPASRSSGNSGSSPKDAVVLTGRYTQQGLEGCVAREPVRELEFQPENRFSVTFMPFETYRDYWGTYSFDPATGKLRLTVDGGNFVPPNLDLEGEAELKAGRLRLKDMFLGSRDGPRQSRLHLRLLTGPGGRGAAWATHAIEAFVVGPPRGLGARSFFILRFGAAAARRPSQGVRALRGAPLRKHVPGPAPLLHGRPGAPARIFRRT
jgi:hypothetical protein